MAPAGQLLNDAVFKRRLLTVTIPKHYLMLWRPPVVSMPPKLSGEGAGLIGPIKARYKIEDGATRLAPIA